MLLPTVVVAWVILFSLSLFGIVYLPENSDLKIYIIFWTILIAVDEFFIAYYMVPKRKILTGIIIAIAYTLITMYAWWGMMHLAY